MQILVKRNLTLEQRIESPRSAANLRNINTNSPNTTLRTVSTEHRVWSCSGLRSSLHHPIGQKEND